jgi:hypothetical protein
MAKIKAIKTGNNRQTVYKDGKAFVHLSLPDARNTATDVVNLELEKRAKELVYRIRESGEK